MKSEKRELTDSQSYTQGGVDQFHFVIAECTDIIGQQGFWNADQFIYRLGKNHLFSRVVFLKDRNLVRKHVHCFGVKPFGIFIDYFNVSRFRPLYRLLASRSRKKAYFSPPRRNFGRHVNGQPMAGGYFYSLRNGHKENIA